MTTGNYLYPFFWQHGESHEVLGEYMEQIALSGMKGVCIEARPHPEFVQKGWWEDMDFLLEKAEQLNMKMWILDDSHFPTGYANGRIKKDYPQYRKMYLDMRRYDMQGPLAHARIDFTLLKERPWEKPDDSREILGVYLARRDFSDLTQRDAIDPTSLTDISEQYDARNNLLTLDVADGAWSVFIVFLTRKGGEEATEDYLNPLVKEATQVLLQEVYEPHYAHYKEKFGTTIQGFFSDEPRFGNAKGTQAKIGSAMVLPWRKGFEQLLPFETKYLPLLWVTAGGQEKDIRFQYMDIVTEQYHLNFTKVLADWCHAHGVWYLGHNIEDNGAHARLGYGTGHYFRGQMEMDFAGIDVIGTQIVPGMNYHHDAFSTGGSDGDFYHYALAKLASSAAHLDPRKQGRAMCEAFGAYGWNEGLKTMKWIADNLMARGINYLVPHAFDPKAFPDYDCPPHFYAHGHNPQFRYFKPFTDYTNRTMSIFREGRYPARVGLLYPAELEWGGEAMAVELPARELTQSQISFDIVTRDYLKKAEVKNGVYRIHETNFEVLVIPYGAWLSEDLEEVLRTLSENKVKLIFINSLYGSANPAIAGICEVTDLMALSGKLAPYRCVTTQKKEEDLVVGEYIRDDLHIYLFFNESTGREIDERISLSAEGYVYAYDAYGHTFTEKRARQTDTGSAYTLHLSPYETIIWIVSPKRLTAFQGAALSEPLDEPHAAEGARDTVRVVEGETSSERKALALGEKQVMTTELVEATGWTVSFADALSYPDFTCRVPIDTLSEVQVLEGWEKVCGTVRYEKEVSLPKASRIVLDLGNVFETAEVFVNGVSAGVRLAKPYTFDLTDLVKDGSNHIAIEVTNTLGTAIRDGMSQYLMIEPFGIQGEVKLYAME